MLLVPAELLCQELAFFLDVVFGLQNGKMIAILPVKIMYTDLMRLKLTEVTLGNNPVFLVSLIYFRSSKKLLQNDRTHALGLECCSAYKVYEYYGNVYTCNEF